MNLENIYNYNGWSANKVATSASFIFGNVLNALEFFQRGIVLHVLGGFDINEVLDPHVVAYAAAIYRYEFVFMDDNARPHRARVVDQFVEENGIELMACKIPRLQPNREPLG